MCLVIRKALRSAPFLTAVLVATCICAAPTTSRAQSATTKQLSPNQVQAAEHFQRARVLYKAGSYREAIDELEKAHDLDPTAKDLVLNLATVSERLGRIDDALKYSREYEQMDLTTTERDRTAATIHRLEGAKREIDAQKAAQQQSPQKPVEPPPPPPPPESRPHGRIDALTIGAAAVAVAGFAVGTVFGVKALADKPAASGYVAGTGPGANGTYADLQHAADHSNSEARVADVAFIVGGVATIGAAVLFFARTRDPDTTTQATPPHDDSHDASSRAKSKTLDAWVAPTIGGVMLGGSF